MSSPTTSAPAPVDETPLRRKGPSPLKKTGNYLVMIVITLVFVAPILYMVIGSFKPSDKVLDGLAGFLPVDLSLDNSVTRGTAPRRRSCSRGVAPTSGVLQNSGTTRNTRGARIGAGRETNLPRLPRRGGAADRCLNQTCTRRDSNP